MNKKRSPKDHEPGSGKVAPGVEVCYKITFQPRTQEDYEVDLIAVTEREKFVVPIRAMGVRV